MSLGMSKRGILGRRLTSLRFRPRAPIWRDSNAPLRRRQLQDRFSGVVSGLLVLEKQRAYRIDSL